VTELAAHVRPRRECLRLFLRRAPALPARRHASLTPLDNIHRHVPPTRTRLIDAFLLACAVGRSTRRQGAPKATVPPQTSCLRPPLVAPHRKAKRHTFSLTQRRRRAPQCRTARWPRCARASRSPITHHRVETVTGTRFATEEGGLYSRSPRYRDPTRSARGSWRVGRGPPGDFPPTGLAQRPARRTAHSHHLVRRQDSLEPGPRAIGRATTLRDSSTPPSACAKRQAPASSGEIDARTPGPIQLLKEAKRTFAPTAR